ncbi:hypothetical protein HYV10_00885 [Candidatus Dependentiae bacterium]|nr:hypothetical protein [Candidatus Dependentiae bacterium]
MSHSLIDTIFNCMNLAARIGVVVYLIKKYIVPKISSSIIYQKESLKILEQQHRELKGQVTDIEKQIKDQEQLYFDLQAKFVLWQVALEKEQQEYDRACKEYEQKLAYQLERKQQHTERRALIKNELPAILKKVKKDLQDLTKKDPRIGKRYMQNLLDYAVGK